jgi:iron complex outermembrane receptor protein
MKFRYFLFFVLLSVGLYAQKDTIYTLSTVVLEAPFSLRNTLLNTTVLQDSLATKRRSTIVYFQQKQNIYFKEYGSGMVSTIALRGTTASQTGVFWNGIPINSLLNGQTDFNVLSLNGINRITLKKGGGSVYLGSSAMGGAINLSNDYSFEKGLHGEIAATYGSFTSIGGNVALHYKEDKNTLSFSGNLAQSENDYPFLGTSIKNENGEIKQRNLQFSYQYKFNTKHQVYLKTSQDFSNRNLSRTLYTQGKDSLNMKNERVLLGWGNTNKKFAQELKTAYTNEVYDYIYDNTQPEINSLHQAENYYAQYQTKLAFKPNKLLHSGLTYQYSQAWGDDLGKHYLRKVGFFLMHLQQINNFKFQVAIRKDWSSLYKIPMVLSLESQYKLSAKSKFLTNISTNYRTPTFNDLYWTPGGNIDLKPENNFSLDAGYHFQTKSFTAQMVGYIINTKNQIQWQPNAHSVWSPINLNRTKAYGLEVISDYTFARGDFQTKAALQYTFTNAFNTSTKQHLMYVPMHFAQLELSVEKPFIRAQLNNTFSGKIFTTTEETHPIGSYILNTVQVDSNQLFKQFNIAFIVANTFNKKYELMAARPMPGRNFKLSINFNF